MTQIPSPPNPLKEKSLGKKETGVLRSEPGLQFMNMWFGLEADHFHSFAFNIKLAAIPLCSVRTVSLLATLVNARQAAWLKYRKFGGLWVFRRQTKNGTGPYHNQFSNE